MGEVTYRLFWLFQSIGMGENGQHGSTPAQLLYGDGDGNGNGDGDGDSMH